MRSSGALLGISQRQIRAVCSSISRPKYSRKRVPTSPKSLGDWLVLKRIEANLSQEEVARKLGVGEKTVGSWERDNAFPSDEQWRRLGSVLRFDSEFLPLETMQRNGVPGFAQHSNTPSG